MTHDTILSPVFEANDDPSLDPRVVVGLEVEIVVSVCPLPEHHNVDSDALFLHLDIQEGTVASHATMSPDVSSIRHLQ